MWMSAKSNPPEVRTYVTLGKTGRERLTHWNGERWSRDGIMFWQIPEPRPVPGELSPTPYLNTETKQKIALIAGMQGCIEGLLAEPMRNEVAVKPLLKEAGQRLHAALDLLFMGTDTDQTGAVMKLVKCSTIRVCAKSTELKEDWIVCNVNDLNILGTMAVENAECAMCEASKYEVKKCELRKILLRVGATAANDTLDCPFKGII